MGCEFRPDDIQAHLFRCTNSDTSWTLIRPVSGAVFLLAGCPDAPAPIQCVSVLHRDRIRCVHEGCKEEIWLRQLTRDLTQDVPQLTSCLLDNLGMQLLANPVTVHNSSTPHIDVRHHFIRGCVASGSIALRYVRLL